MLFWSKFFLVYLFIYILLFNLYLNSLLSLILVVEFITILTFFLYLFSGLLFNLNWVFGFSFVIIVFGGLEAALSFLLLNL